jgi:hypothetical protein
MHPNTYLRTFWRAQIKPQVFVAMSFAEAYQQRFSEIIERAITSVSYQGQQLQAVRVDLSKSGDSILTDIVDGIAHSAMVLADVSIVGHDSKSSAPYRNANVFYEVGLALASRQSSEVLLIRDDKEPFLFDVSTVPHMHINFAERETARELLSQEIAARLREIDHVRDARIAIAVTSLTSEERHILSMFAKFGMDRVFCITKVNIGTLATVPRLLDKQLIVTVGATKDGKAIFRWTELGHALATQLEVHVPVIGIPAEQMGCSYTRAR